MTTITKTILYSTALFIATSNVAQRDEIRLTNLNKQQATRCTWTPNRTAEEFRDPTKQIAGWLRFFDRKGNKLREVDYNPIRQEIRYINQQRQAFRQAFPRNTFKAIGEALDLDVANLDETECNETIAAWLPAKQDSCCVIQ